MPVYWTKKSVPELASLSKEDRERVWTATQWKAFRHWQTWLALAAIAGIFSLLPTLSGVLRDRGWSTAARVLVGGSIAGVVGLVANTVAVTMRRPHMRAEIESLKSGQDESA